MTDKKNKNNEVQVDIDEEISTVILTDENGVDIEFEVLGVVEHNKEEFAVLLQADQAEEDEGEVEILKIVEEDGDEVLMSFDDMELMEEVFNIFISKLED